MTAKRLHTQQVRSEEKIRGKGQSEELVLRVPAAIPWRRGKSRPSTNEQYRHQEEVEITSLVYFMKG